MTKPPIVSRASLRALAEREWGGSPKVVGLPFNEWRQRWEALHTALDAAYAEANSFCARVPYSPRFSGEYQDHVFILPAVNSPEWAAREEVYRRKVFPALRALEEFHSRTRVLHADEEPQPRAQTPERQDDQTSLHDALLAAVAATPGASKAAVLRAVGDDPRVRRRATSVLQALIAEGAIRWDAPPTPGAAGQCWLEQATPAGCV